jgi:hypothetical protein
MSFVAEADDENRSFSLRGFFSTEVLASGILRTLPPRGNVASFDITSDTAILTIRLF